MRHEPRVKWAVLAVFLITLPALAAWNSSGNVWRSQPKEGNVVIAGKNGALEDSGKSLSGLEFLTGVGKTESDAFIIVVDATTDTERYANMTNAYEKAKLLTPGGNVLSSTNRATVIMPIGVYDAGTNTFLLDTDYVDIVAMYPEVCMGGHRDYLATHEQTLTSLGWTVDEFLFPKTRLKGMAITNNQSLVVQSIEDIRLVGFSMEYYWNGDGDGQEVAFEVTAPEGGQYSHYEKMTFFTDVLYDTRPTEHRFHFDGEWLDCIGADYSFRMSNDFDPSPTPIQEFRATMVNCHAGRHSYVGDSKAAAMVGAYFERCTTAGAGFGGCNYHGAPADADTTFIDCEAPWGYSFALGKECAATLIRCRGGRACAGSTVTSVYQGTFTGYAEDCLFGGGSLGGRGFPAVGGPVADKSPTWGTNFISGVVNRCTVTNSLTPHYLMGAIVRDSYFLSSDGMVISDNWVLIGPDPGDPNDWELQGLITNYTALSAFSLLDSTSIIVDSVLEMNDTGAGAAVIAEAAQNIVFIGNTVNNADVAPDGLGLNVTAIAGVGDWVDTTLAQSVLKNGTVTMEADLSLGSFDLTEVRNIELGTILPTGSEIVIQGGIRFGGNVDFDDKPLSNIGNTSFKANAEIDLNQGYIVDLYAIADPTFTSLIQIDADSIDLTAATIEVMGNLDMNGGLNDIKNARNVYSGTYFGTGPNFLFGTAPDFAGRDSINVGELTMRAGGASIDLNGGYVTDFTALSDATFVNYISMDADSIDLNTGIVILNGCPTSSAGLPSGAIWSDSGTLKIIP